jgi:hypothetical protein
MASDISTLLQALQKDPSLADLAGLDSDQIIAALRRESVTSSDPLEIFKNSLLSKAAEMQALGSL